MLYSYVPSPFGDLLVAGDRDALKLVSFPMRGRKKEPEAGWKRADSAFAEVRRQLADYFAGKRTTFDLELAPEGTEFQRIVWTELQRIPYGETISYGELARRIGNPNAQRAVGAANGQNPVSIIIPCHRVIGANGSLTGFGGGLPTKKALLAHEQGGQARLRL